MAEIHFIDEAIEDLSGLDGSALRLVLGKLRILETNAEAGQPLGRRKTGNLTNFRKLVVGNRDYRIVFRIEDNGDVCVIWVIAARGDDEAYDATISRLEQLGNDPTARKLIDALESMKPAAARAVIKIRPDVAEQVRTTDDQEQ